MRDISQAVENIIGYGLRKGLIETADAVFTRNALYDLFGAEFPEGDLPVAEFVETAIEAIEPLFAEDLTPAERDLLDARIMGIFTPRPSEVNRRFFELHEDSPDEATRYFYALSEDNHYIRTDQIAKNLYWTVGTPFGELEITVNLSKPEKDPKDIAAALKQPQKNYPKCLLCAENVGFAGHLNHPARQNLRVIPMTLDGEQWYFQYSPYVYYNEHCIVLNEKHTPMKITESTFKKLADFVDILPSYFIGSNADLPIVGGSILSHDHFQGGRHVFAMEKAKGRAFYTHAEFPGLNVSVLNWPMSVIRISGGAMKPDMLALAMRVLNEWRGYSDAEAGVLAFSGGVPHNTVTPILRRNTEGSPELDLVLRNNRTTEEHPLGIFHPHADLHHIKKENIGLIEVMGLAVLPGRLDAEMDVMARWLAGDDDAFEDRAVAAHAEWLKTFETVRSCVKGDTYAAREFLKREIGLVFAKVLADAGVFKADARGAERFDMFMRKCGFVRLA